MVLKILLIILLLHNFKLEKTGKVIHTICNEIKNEVAKDAITHKELLDFVYNRY